MATTRAARSNRLALKAARPTYELRTSAWKLLADQDPDYLYVDGPKSEINVSAIAREAGLSQTTLLKLKNGDQTLTLEILACLTNLLIRHGWDRVEAQEALIKPLRFASNKARLVAL